MNGMLSNSRGLGDLTKHLFFVDCIRDHNLDFLAILETGRWEFTQIFLTAFQVELTLCGILGLPVDDLLAS
jgi:hypothetical protein